MTAARRALALLLVAGAACATLPETRGRGADLSGVETIRIEIDPASVEETRKWVEVFRAEMGLRSTVRTVFAMDLPDAPAEARLAVLGRWTTDAVGRRTFVSRLDLFRTGEDRPAWHHDSGRLQFVLDSNETIETTARAAARRLAEALGRR